MCRGILRGGGGGNRGGIPAQIFLIPTPNLKRAKFCVGASPPRVKLYGIIGILKLMKILAFQITVTFQITNYIIVGIPPPPNKKSLEIWGEAPNQPPKPKIPLDVL